MTQIEHKNTKKNKPIQNADSVVQCTGLTDVWHSEEIAKDVNGSTTSKG